MKIDMNDNRAIVHCMPDFMMNTQDFHKYIKIGIKSRGYNMIRQDNLLVCIGFIGKLSNTSDTRYQLKKDQALMILGSKGIQTIEAQIYDPEDLAGLEWKVGDFLKKPSLVPTRSKIYIKQNRETSLKFSNYKYKSLEGSEEEKNFMIVELKEEGSFMAIETFTDAYDLKKELELTDEQAKRLRLIINAKSSIKNFTYKNYRLLEDYHEVKLQLEEPELSIEEHQGKLMTIFRKEKLCVYLLKKTPLEEVFFRSDPRSIYIMRKKR